MNNWIYIDGDLKDAHAEIELLRGYRDAAEADAAAARLLADKSRLTDAEREAVEYFAAFHRSPREGDAAAAATLRGLLERLGTAHKLSESDSICAAPACETVPQTYPRNDENRGFSDTHGASMGEEEIARAWTLVNKYGPPNSWTAANGTLAAALGRALQEIGRLRARKAQGG